MPDEKPKEGAEEKKPQPMVEEEPIVTHHSIKTASGDKLSYSVTAGRLPLKDDEEEIQAQIFFTAYTKDGVSDPSQRPLMFSFNGGPGSPSVWLHLGALGPRRVQLLENGEMPAPPFKLVDNHHTWLEDCDLVFIDPVNTGFSRAKDKETAEKYLGVKGDIESVSEFIRLYLTRFARWTSPLYLVGESYGTLRAAGISGHLIDKGVAFNGIVLVSSILNYQTARFFKGNDLPFILFLPTYTATAWYHKKLGPELAGDLAGTLKAVEEFAIGEYASALAKGDLLPGEERANIRRKLAEFTGLSETYVENRDLRIEIHSFCKELLREQKRTVGRLDSRFIGIDANAAAEVPEHDPSMSAIMPPYMSTYQQYVRAELGYKSDLEYRMFSLRSNWNWGSAGEGLPDTSEALRKALSKNPYMKLYIASGYYDLATPYFATEYTLAHMGLDPTLRENISTGEYEAGHMMYIHAPSLEKLKNDISGFISSTHQP